MKFDFLSRVCRLAAIGAILLGSASCISVNERLGENLIPTDQRWDVFSQDPAPLKDIRMHMASNLSGYSATRFTLGAVTDDLMGTSVKGTSFTLVPLVDSIDFGQNTKVTGFHFTAARDTLSMVYDNQERILQNIYVSALKAPLDSTVLYTGTFMNEEIAGKFLNLEDRITEGVPVYDGGDSLSFDFSTEYAERVIAGIKRFQALAEPECDSLDFYLKEVPGIYITTDTPVGLGGRINMFGVGLDYDSSLGYITGNYAELKITADYDDRTDVDTSFLFMFGPGDFLKNLEDSEDISQYAFNASYHYYEANTQLGSNADALSKNGLVATDKIYVEGGSGVKPVISAKEIREIIEEQIANEGIEDLSEVVINKATLVLPYNVEGDFSLLDKFPTILSPTVCLHSSEGNYVTYAGLTDSSVATENQGDINRSRSIYSPDISHHVQEIMKVKRDADYDKNIAKYDIWLLIMHEEVIESESSGSAYDDYYQNLMYNSYYNNMMYDPYGYGYGYGYGGYGYGYGGYGYDSYGYSNYYNYLMMAQYASASSSSSTSSIELDKDRYYRCYLNGPESSLSDNQKPHLKVTFSAPKSAEE